MYYKIDSKIIDYKGNGLAIHRVNAICSVTVACVILLDHIKYILSHVDKQQ